LIFFIYFIFVIFNTIIHTLRKIHFGINETIQFSLLTRNIASDPCLSSISKSLTLKCSVRFIQFSLVTSWKLFAFYTKKMLRQFQISDPDHIDTGFVHLAKPQGQYSLVRNTPVSDLNRFHLHHISYIRELLSQ